VFKALPRRPNPPKKTHATPPVDPATSPETRLGCRRDSRPAGHCAEKLRHRLDRRPLVSATGLASPARPTGAHLQADRVDKTAQRATGQADHKGVSGQFSRTSSGVRRVQAKPAADAILRLPAGTGRRQAQADACARSAAATPVGAAFWGRQADSKQLEVAAHRGEVGAPRRPFAARPKPVQRQTARAIAEFAAAAARPRTSRAPARESPGTTRYSQKCP